MSEPKFATGGVIKGSVPLGAERDGHETGLPIPPEFASTSAARFTVVPVSTPVGDPVEVDSYGPYVDGYYDGWAAANKARDAQEQAAATHLVAVPPSPEGPEGA